MEIVELLIELIVYAAVNKSVNKDISIGKLNHKIREGLNITEKQLYLFLIILMYLFYENDGKFTHKEKRLIKRELKNRKGELSFEDYKLYKSVIYKKHNLDKVVTEIKRCEYDQLIVSRVLRDIKIMFIEDDSYRKALIKLDSALFNLV